MHPSIPNPLLKEIRYKIKAKFNQSQENQDEVLDFLFLSWSAKMLAMNDSDINQQLALLFSPYIERIMNDNLKIGNLQMASLKALFNCAEMLLMSDVFDNGTLRKMFEELTLILDKKQWLSSPTLASYAVYGLKRIVSESCIDNARIFIRKYFGNEISKAAFKYPEILLGLPELCTSFREQTENLIETSEVNRDAILLLVMVENKDKFDAKWFKEMVLLLHNNIEKKLVDGIEDQNLIALCQVGLSLVGLGYESVHLLNKIDYFTVKSLFETKAVAIPEKVEYVQEVIILLVMVVMFYIAIVLSAPHFVFFLQSTGMLPQLIPEFAAVLLFGFLGFLLFRLIFPVLLPHLWQLRCRIPFFCKGGMPNENH